MANEGAKAGDDVGEDPLTFRPNPDALVSKVDEDAEDGGAAGGVYRPPKMLPTAMDNFEEGGKSGKEKRKEKEARRRASRSALIKVCRSTTMTPPYLPPLSLLSPPSFLLPGISSLYYLTPFSSAPSLSLSPSLRLGVSLSSSFFLLPFLSCLYCAPRFTFHVSLGFVFFTQFRFECSCHSLPHSSGTFRHVSIHGD